MKAVLSDAPELEEFTVRYHLRPAYLWHRLTGPGRQGALPELALLARYALRPFA